MWLLLTLNLFSFTAAVTSEGCSISTNGDLGEPQPLIVNYDYTIRHPQEGDVVSFLPNETFLLSCPSSYLVVRTDNTTLILSEDEIGTCVSNKQFKVQNTTTIFSNITCNGYPYHVARLTNETCEERKQEIEVGFFVNSSIYVRHMRICFDNKQHVTTYCQFELLPNIQGRQSGFPRPNWINGDFYNFGNSSFGDANSLMTVVNQIATISNLIGYSSNTTNPYVNSTADLYLARGHLTAKADFVFGAQQRLTFHMVNAAPQWQTFNGRNWAYLEEDARNLAIEYNLTLQVYTGTYRVMSLPHVSTNLPIPIYLYNDNNGNREYPVPLLFWKFLYEPISKAGIVLIGVNNPYITNLSEAIICKDIYESINWTTTFDKNNIVDGYMYACSPDDFRRTVTYVPNVPVKSLLLFNSSYTGAASLIKQLNIFYLTVLILLPSCIKYLLL